MVRHKAIMTPQQDQAVNDLVKRMNRELRRRGLHTIPERIYNRTYFDMLEPSVMIRCMIDMQTEINALKDKKDEDDG